MIDHYGWRGRIGLIYMNTGTVMEPEFHAMAPDGVSIHTDRIFLREVTVNGLDEMMDSDGTERCAESLARAPLNSMVFGGTSATFLRGLGYDETIKARMAQVAKGIPVTTTSSAALKGLRTLGVTRLAFVGPYDAHITERGRSFFSENGFDVLSADGMGLKTDKEIGAVTLEAVYDFAKRCATPQTDGVFISCTNLRSVGAIAALEADLGVPVVSAIQASFWDALRLAGVRASRPGFGSLFKH